MEKNLKDADNTKDDIQKDKIQEKTKKETGSGSTGNKALRSGEEKLLHKNSIGEYDSVREGLHYCTKAPAPEQAGWHHDDEPCDDGRSGNID